MKDQLNARYAELCQELGHLQCNLELLQKRITEVKSEIFGINQLVADITKKTVKEPQK